MSTFCETVTFTCKVAHLGHKKEYRDQVAWYLANTLEMVKTFLILFFKNILSNHLVLVVQLRESRWEG